MNNKPSGDRISGVHLKQAQVAKSGLLSRTKFLRKLDQL